MNILLQQRALLELDKVLLFKKAEQCRKDFYMFFRHFAWPVLEPGTEYQDNWHIHAICEHLQAITEGHINRLIINLPYRLLKSRLVSQSWQAWEWLQYPSTEWLTASFAMELAIRDAVASRHVIESPAYRECFGHLFQMTTDQNVKSHYQNTAQGKRFVTSTQSGATGFGGNRILLDDPLSVAEADSELKRDRSWEWFKGTLSTRFNNPAKDAAVVVHQRLHAQDTTGRLLEEQPGLWDHLILPMRYETQRLISLSGIPTIVPTETIKTSIGYSDPRRVEGELLFPARLDEKAVDAMALSIGQYHVDAQLQQHPASRGGTIFERANWRFYDLPPVFDEVILSVDCTFKDVATSDYVAVQVWGRKGPNKYLIKRLRERLGFGATVQAIRTMAAMYSKRVAILIEDKANGPAVIETLSKELSGVLAINPEGGKVSRAFACQPDHEAGNLWLPDPSIDPTIEQFISETASFPNVAHDDETDAMTQAINWFRNRVRSTGLLDYYQAQLDAQNAARAA